MRNTQTAFQPVGRHPTLVIYTVHIVSVLELASSYPLDRPVPVIHAPSALEEFVMPRYHQRKTRSDAMKKVEDSHRKWAKKLMRYARKKQMSKAN